MVILSGIVGGYSRQPQFPADPHGIFIEIQVVAERIREKTQPPSQQLLQPVMPAGNLFTLFFRGQLAQARMSNRVRADQRQRVGCQFPQLSEPQCPELPSLRYISAVPRKFPTRIHRSCRDKEDRRNLKFPQDRQSIFQIIRIPVVEGNHKPHTVIPIPRSVERQYLKMATQKIKLLPEIFRCHRQLIRILRQRCDPMVSQQHYRRFKTVGQNISRDLFPALNFISEIHSIHLSVLYLLMEFILYHEPIQRCLGRQHITEYLHFDFSEFPFR